MRIIRKSNQIVVCLVLWSHHHHHYHLGAEAAISESWTDKILASSSERRTSATNSPSKARIEETWSDQIKEDWSIMDNPFWQDDELDLVGRVPAQIVSEDPSMTISSQHNAHSEVKQQHRLIPSSVSLQLQETQVIMGTQMGLQDNDVFKKFKKTGTTIAGCCVRDHVILAADTRATESTMVADKKCQKLHQLSTNSWCAGAGTSADLDHLTKHCLYSMALQRLQESSIGNTGGSDQILDRLHAGDDNDEDILLIGAVSIDALCHFLQEALYDGSSNLGVNLIMGGVWKGEAYLRAIHPHGSMDVDLPFAALGSGGLNAMSILERGYRNDLSVQDATQLVQNAIVAGIQNDLGSGSQVDLCVIYPDGTSKLTRCVVPEQKLEEKAVIQDQPTSIETENMGVNGFGNQPFGVQSKKVRLASVETEEKGQLSLWNDVLGLSENDES